MVPYPARSNLPIWVTRWRSGEFRYTGWFRINADEAEFEELYDLTNEAFERKNVSNEKLSNRFIWI